MSFLSLKLADRFVDLPDDFSLTLNLKSPMFGEVGSYSYPFRVPATPKNKIILGFRHRPETTADPAGEETGVIAWKGIQMFSGTMRMKNINGKHFEGSLYEGVADFFYQRREATLQDVDFSKLYGFTTEANKLSYINWLKDKNYPDYEICFPQIENLSYFEELPDDVRLRFFNYYENGEIKSKYTYNGTTNNSVIVPMLYLRYVLKKIFEHVNYEFTDSFFAADEEFRNLALFNLVDCNTDFISPGFFNYTKKDLLLNYHLPNMPLNDFLQGLENFFNLRLFVNNNRRTACLKSLNTIVQSSDHLEFSARIISIGKEIEERITGFHLKHTIDTDDEWYEAAKSSQELSFSHLKATVQSVADLNPFPASVHGDVRYVIDEGMYYRLNYTVWEPFYAYTSPFFARYEFIYRGYSETIESKFSTLFMHDTSQPDDAAVVGNTRESWREVTPKLFFTRYIDNGGTDQKLIARPALANNDLFYSDGLWHESETGLFKKHWKDWLEFRINTRLLKIVKQMTFIELKDFDFSRKVMINGRKYLVKSIQVTLKKDRIMPATLELYTCD